MFWDVKIEDKSNQKIRVVFNPTEETISFFGVYKPKNQQWVVFGEILHESLEITLEQIQENIFKVYEIMAKRVAQYENMAEGFKVIKEIAIDDGTIKNEESNIPPYSK